MFTRMRIFFRHGGDIVIPQEDWDDYDFFEGSIIIKKDQAWIAMYNAKDVFSVVLEKGDENGELSG